MVGWWACYVVNTATPGNPITETEDTWRYSETLAMHHHIRTAMCVAGSRFHTAKENSDPHDRHHCNNIPNVAIIERFTSCIFSNVHWLYIYIYIYIPGNSRHIFLGPRSHRRRHTMWVTCETPTASVGSDFGNIRLMVARVVHPGPERIQTRIPTGRNTPRVSLPLNKV